MKKLKQITNDELITLVNESKSSAELARRLGYSPKSGTITRLKKKLVELNIDTSHWTGQLWNKGKTSLEDARMRPRKPNEEIFSENSNAAATYVRKLVKTKKLLPEGCQMCNVVDSWNGKPINLQLDHINGIRHDHRLENLRWLCPNCHSQTDTFCGRNSKFITRKKTSDEDLISALKTSRTIRQALQKVGLDIGIHYKRVKRLTTEFNIQVGSELPKLEKLIIPVHTACLTPPKEGKHCKTCSELIDPMFVNCSKCYNSFTKPTKISWPPKEELEKLVWEQPCIVIAKQLGVSDSTLDKRCRRFNIKKPPMGYWAKKKADNISLI